MTITATKDLRAYHGDEKLKEETVAKARWHKDFSEFVKDTYFSKNGKTKVCAVGCITEDPNGGHHLYPTKWGIPEWLAYLEERIFTGLPDEKMAQWPERFLDAIPVGADFEGLADRLAIRRLREECLPLSRDWPESIRAQVVASIEQTIAALQSGKEDELSADFFPRTTDEISPSYSRRWPNSGFTTSPGECWTADTSACPSEGSVSSSLPDVLVAHHAPRFFLSPRAAAGILKRALERERLLPPPLVRGLEDLASRLPDDDRRTTPPPSTPTPARQGTLWGHSWPTASGPTRSRPQEGISSLEGRTEPPRPETSSLRRLTPTERERLQGFPDGWTIPYGPSLAPTTRGQTVHASDRWGTRSRSMSPSGSGAGSSSGSE